MTDLNCNAVLHEFIVQKLLKILIYLFCRGVENIRIVVPQFLEQIIIKPK